MNEADKIKRARAYVEHLANGINPLTGQAVPETEVLNNVRISRCLFYVADVLRQIDENGGARKKQTGVKKVPFQLSQESREKFRFSETPMPISEMTRRINALIDETTMQKLGYRDLLEWLTKSGALSTAVRADGKTERHPTPDGARLGITEERREGRNGLYSVIVYNRAAQQFVLDNLDAVIAQKQQKSGQAGDAGQEA